MNSNRISDTSIEHTKGYLIVDQQKLMMLCKSVNRWISRVLRQETHAQFRHTLL